VTGLHHVALNFSSQARLAETVQRLLDAGIELRQLSDHGTHLAVYLSDPDGNDLELAWDRPFEHWPRYGSENPAFLDAPLDLDELLTAVADPSDSTHQPGETSMDITIIGTGNMARGIATRALARGHTVTLLGTESGKAEALAGELSGDARGGAFGDALVGDVVVLAIPYTAIDDVLSRYGDQLAGKTVVDITNPIDFSSFTPLTIDAGSAAAEIAQKAPAAKVVKAWNTTFAGTLVEGKVAGQSLDVLVASDDDGAKATIRQIVEDGGSRAVDAGPLARAHELEALGYLHMALQQPLDTGFASTVKVLS
jgi:predicted dinucleotide-binding enzyme